MFAAMNRSQLSARLLKQFYGVVVSQRFALQPAYQSLVPRISAVWLTTRAAGSWKKSNSA